MTYEQLDHAVRVGSTRMMVDTADANIRRGCRYTPPKLRVDNRCPTAVEEEQPLTMQRFMADLGGDHNCPTLAEYCTVIDTDNGLVIVHRSYDRSECDAKRMTLRAVTTGHKVSKAIQHIWDMVMAPTQHCVVEDVMTVTKARSIGAREMATASA